MPTTELGPGPPRRPGPTSPGPRTCCAASAEPAGPAERRGATCGSPATTCRPPACAPLSYISGQSGQGAPPGPAPCRQGGGGGPAQPLPRGRRFEPRGQQGTRVAGGRRGTTPPGLGTLRPGPPCPPSPLAVLGTVASSQQLPPAQGEQRGTPKECSICSREGRSLWVPWGHP